MRLLLLSFALACALAAQTEIELPTEVAPPGGQAFQFDAASARELNWTVPGLKRAYFREDLPALFSRTLALDDALPAGSALDWIFTGQQGGITIKLTSAKLTVLQRYYDSIGLSSARPPKSNYPEAVWAESEVLYRGDLRSVTVVLDHQLALLVSLNGTQVVKQTCLMEVRRQQLAWTPVAGAKQGKLTGRLIDPPVVVTGITVTPERKRQTIWGFGGSISFPAYAQLSPEGKKRWWALLLEYNLLVHREYPNGQNLKPDLSNFDRLEDANPHYYGDNFPNGEISDFQYLKRIREMGGKSIFEFWQLPPWALREGKAASGRLSRVPIVPEYLRAVLGYCKLSRERSGFAPDVVGVQNEIGQSPETWHEMILKLREALDREGFQSVKIQMPDASDLAAGTRAARAIQNSPAAWKAIDYAATHVYDFQSFFENPDGYDDRARQWRESIGDKPFLGTEYTVNRPPYQSPSYRIAFAMAQLYHKSMSIMDAQALLYCWTLLDVEQPSFGASRSLLVPDRENGYVPAPSGFELRTFGAFSRRLREGMVRVDAASTDPGLLVTAYEGVGGTRTAILINRSTSPRSVRIAWPGASFTSVEVASPYAGTVMPAANAVPLVIQPGEIATLSNVPLLVSDSKN